MIYMRYYLFFLTLFSLHSFLCFGARVDTVDVYSETMDKSIKTVIIQPEKRTKDILPTLYLLHGYSGKYSDWVLKAPHIKEFADLYEILIVCPDGGFGSWYWDIEGDTNYQYETFVSNELIHFVENEYGAERDRKYRAITGLSMGGHGAMSLALKHQDIYSAVGSTAGGVDYRPFPNNWEIKDRLGSYDQNKEKWDAHTVMEMLNLYKPKELKIFIDCGQQDFFYKVNEKLHEKLNYLNIPHHYLTLPGGHNWDYWKESIKYQIVFFSDVFFN